MTNILFEIATWLVPLTIAIVFHEVAHGRMAHALGDPTAAELGRLSLNPIRHVDPFGTVILPMILAVSGAPIFGWAKPVPFNPTRLRDPRWGSVLVAAAGPASNIVLALVGALGVALAAKSLGAEEGSTMASVIIGNLSNFIAINLFLAVFNMIPLPPFDGSKVLAGFLPDGWRQSFQNLDRYALLFMIGLLFILPQFGPEFDVLSKLVDPPVRWLFEQIITLVSHLV
ncbi:MAG: site-2 protease family protein [Sphingomonadales bacterium]|jgi:Zn-dependent protease|nr:site-2 protease family protein [Sphingomonadales bacterium]